MQQPSYGYPTPYYPQPGSYHQQQPYAYGPSPAPAPYAHASQGYYYPSPPANVPFPQQPAQHAPDAGRHGRHSSTSKKPLKSAMKPSSSKNRPSTGSRPNSAQGYYPSGAPVTRKRTYSGGTNRTSHSGHSTASKSFAPDHIFLTFVGDNQIEVENSDNRVQDAIKEDVIPVWPTRATFSTDKKDRWIVTFNGSPWTQTGYHPRKLVQLLFKALAKCQWFFVASVSPTNPKKGSARLCFARDPYDQSAHLFVPVWFSNSGWTINMIEAPSHVPESIELGMKNVFNHKRVSAIGPSHSTREWSCTFKPSNHKDPDTDKALITARLLQLMRSHYLDLHASIPLGGGGLLGFGSKKEIWIFHKNSSTAPA